MRVTTTNWEINEMGHKCTTDSFIFQFVVALLFPVPGNTCSSVACLGYLGYSGDNIWRKANQQDVFHLLRYLCATASRCYTLYLQLFTYFLQD